MRAPSVEVREAALLRDGRDCAWSLTLACGHSARREPTRCTRTSVSLPPRKVRCLACSVRPRYVTDKPISKPGKYNLQVERLAMTPRGPILHLKVLSKPPKKRRKRRG